MQLSRKVPSTRRMTAVALIAVLVLSLAIPAAAFGATYTVPIKRGASSVYTAQPVNVTGSVSPKVGKGKVVTVQYKKSTSALWKSVEGQDDQGQQVQLQVLQQVDRQLRFPCEVQGGR